MGLTSEGLNLLFTIKGKNEASPEIKKFREDVEKEVKAVKSATDSVFTDLAGSIGLSAQQTAGLSAALPVAGTAITAVAGAALGLTAAAAGLGIAFFGLVKEASDYGSKIFDVTQKTGLGAVAITSLKLAADQGGSSLEAITGSLDKFAKLIGQAESGSKKAKDTLKELGVTSYDLETAFGQFTKTVFDAKDGVEQITLAQKGAGKSGADLIPVFKQVNGQFAEFKKAAEAAGQTLTDADIASADAFGDQLVALTSQLKTTATQVLLEFAPDIEAGMKKISTALSDNSSDIRKWDVDTRDEVRGVIAYFNELTTAITSYKKNRLASFFQNADRYVFGDDFADQNQKSLNLVAPTSAGSQVLEALRQKGLEETVLLPKPQIIPETYDPKKSGTSKDSGKVRKEISDSFDKEFRDIAKDFGFTVGRTLGGAINSGSLHPLGKAGDLRVGGKTDEESFNVIAAFLEKGFRVIDERIVGAFPGIKSTGPNIHAEQGAGIKPSLFLDASKYGGAENLAYLKKLDEDRRNKKTSVDDAAELAKKRVEDEQKANEETVKNREETDKRILANAKNAADEQKAINDDLLAKKSISQDEYDKRSEQSAIDLLTKEKNLLDERLALAKSLGVETVDIEQEIADKVSQIKVKQTEDETAAYLRSKKYLEDLKALRLEVLQAQREAFEQDKEQQRKNLENAVDKSFGSDRLTALVVLRDFEIAENLRRQTEAIEDAQRERDATLETIVDKEKEKEKVEEINKLYQARLDTINQIHTADDENTNKGLNPAINTAGINGGLLGTLAGGLGDAAGGVVDPNNEITNQAERMKAVYNDLKDTAKAAIGSMVQGLGQLLSTWITTGKFSGKAALQMASGIITGLAIQSGIKALLELAEGYAALANPFTAGLAPLHFAAAAQYGIVAAAGAVGVGLGLASRALGGGATAAESQGGFGTAGGSTSGGGNGQTGGRSFTGGAFSGSGDTVFTQTQGANVPQRVLHEIDLTDRNGKRARFIVETLEDNHRRSGSFRELIADIVKDL